MTTAVISTGAERSAAKWRDLAFKRVVELTVSKKGNFLFKNIDQRSEKV